MSATRLNKYIAASGICSRRKADELIESGAVVVNDRKVTELGFLVKDKDKVFINNKLIHPVKHQYYRFFKPAGYITTSDDEKGRKTIYDLIPKELWGLKPVGRLDKDSTGLLILTNDGDLINELTHPSVKVPKVYLVSIESTIHPHELEQMANGIEIEKDKIAYADIEVLEADRTHTMMRITLYQGMNRQIRKMFEYFGYEVKSLKRIQHATIQLEGLKRGEFKPIKPRQIKELRNFLNRIAQKND
ncbi:rRNA pseudouridine synthase [bacterium]|nr:rRNA pseudouridine synthase [bacterium]